MFLAIFFSDIIVLFIYKFLYKFMIKDRCISVTDLRTNTKQCMDGLEDSPKYVFINNKPVAVLMHIEDFEDNFQNFSLVELDSRDVGSQLGKKAAAARKLPTSKLTNI